MAHTYQCRECGKEKKCRIAGCLDDCVATCCLCLRRCKAESMCGERCQKRAGHKGDHMLVNYGFRTVWSYDLSNR